MKSRSRKRTPNIVNLTVKRHHLTERDPRKYRRYEHRDATMMVAPGRQPQSRGTVLITMTRHRPAGNAELANVPGTEFTDGG